MPFFYRPRSFSKKSNLRHFRTVFFNVCWENTHKLYIFMYLCVYFTDLITSIEAYRSIQANVELTHRKPWNIQKQEDAFFSWNFKKYSLRANELTRCLILPLNLLFFFLFPPIFYISNLLFQAAYACSICSGLLHFFFFYLIYENMRFGVQTRLTCMGLINKIHKNDVKRSYFTVLCIIKLLYSTLTWLSRALRAACLFSYEIRRVSWMWTR